MKLRNIIYFSLLLIMLIGGCQLFSPPNVETVVKEDYFDYWYLSPNGDYIIYGAPRGEGSFLFELATDQIHEFDCNLFWWDNYIFGCYKHHNVFVVDVKTLAKNPLTPIDLNKESKNNQLDGATESFVNQLLVKAELIYYPNWTTDTVYILSPNYQLNIEENYIVSGLTNPNELLEKYTYKVVPYKQPSNPKYGKTESPNGLYYWDFTINGFTIYKVNSNEIVSEFVNDEKATELEIGGWATDSSGVYFGTFSFGFGRKNSPQKIRKLTIPNE